MERRSKTDTTIAWGTHTAEGAVKLRRENLKQGYDLEPRDVIILEEDQQTFTNRCLLMELANRRLMKTTDYPKYYRTISAPGASLVTADFSSVTFSPGSIKGSKGGKNIIYFHKQSGSSELDYLNGLQMLIDQSNQLFESVGLPPIPPAPEGQRMQLDYSSE